MSGAGFRFYGSTGPGGAEGASVPDPADWLGRTRAAQRLDEFQSTITATQSVNRRNEIIDSSRIGDGDDVHEFKWIAMQTGPAALGAARVMSFDSATGTFKLDREIGPGLAVSGDTYSVFSPGNVFENVTEQQAAAGDVRFRSIVIENNHGANIDEVRIYFRELTLEATAMDRIHQDVAGLYIERSDDQTDILNSLGSRIVGAGSDGMAGCGNWQHPFSYSAADTTIDPAMVNNTHRGIWLRRTIEAGAQPRRSVAVQIIAESTTTGSDPDPLAGTAIIAFDILGDAPVGELTADRFVHVGGGARMLASVTAGGQPVAFRPVRFDLRVGDQGSVYTDDDPTLGYATTDDAGEAAATFQSGILAPEGEVSHPQLIIGAGTEVGDPQPRVTFSVAIEMSLPVQSAIEVGTPSASELYLDDPFTSLLPNV